MDWDKSTTDICLYSPFLVRALMSLPMVETKEIPTIATDGKQILFNPDFCATLTDKECDGVRVHEVLHVLLGHHVRQGSREHARWNVACDGEINAYVEDAGYKLPADAIRFPQWADKTAEEIYDLLPPSQNMPAWGTITPGAEPGTQAAADQADEWAKMMAGTTWGEVPQNIARAINRQLKPKTDLMSSVAAFLRAAMPGDDETWAPPSRRYSLLPSEGDSPSGHIVACVDSSGSIDQETMTSFLSRVAGLVDVGRLDIVIGDADVNGVWEDVDMDEIERIAKELHGGGGTDFRPVVARAARNHPDAIIYITDGYGEFGTAPFVPVLWAMTTEVKAPWGETLRIKE